MTEHDNYAGIAEMPADPGTEALCNDPRIAAELILLGNEIMAAEPRVAPRRRRLTARPAVVIATVVALALGGTAVAAATTSGFGLFAGYVGNDRLIDTTTWRTEWVDRIDAYTWPRGFDGGSFVDGQVAAGALRPDALPSQDLDHETLALNACAWVAAYQQRLADGDRAGQRAAIAALDEALRKPANEQLDGVALIASITALSVDPGPTAAAVQDFRSTTCRHGLVADAIEGVR